MSDKHDSESLEPGDSSHARAVGGQLLEIAATSSAQHLGKFGDWILGGTSAAIVLALADAERLALVASPDIIMSSLQLLLVAGLFGAWQRFVGAEIASFVAAAKAARDLADEAPADQTEDERKREIAQICEVVAEATPQPLQARRRRDLQQVVSDNASVGLRLAKRSRTHERVVFGQVAFILAAIAVVIFNLRLPI